MFIRESRHGRAQEVEGYEGAGRGDVSGRHRVLIATAAPVVIGNRVGVSSTAVKTRRPPKIVVGDRGTSEWILPKLATE
jgi:hypothetical protein